MPTPNKDEGKDEFVERCIPVVMDEGTAKDADQAVAICNSIWDESKKTKESAMYWRPDERERRCLPAAELRVEGEKGASPKITGYAAVFNTWADIGGWFRESIHPGAFRKTIKENDIRALLNHDPNYVLGRNKAGTLKLHEDEKGLAIEISPADTTWGRDLMTSMKRGDVTQMSFAFDTNKQEVDYDHDERVLMDVTLYDVSIVTYPAYPTTTAEVRSAFQKKDSPPEEVKEDEPVGFSELDRIVGKIKAAEELTEEEVRVVTTYLPDLSVPPAQHTETDSEPPAKHSDEDTRPVDRWKELHDKADALIRKQLIKGDT